MVTTRSSTRLRAKITSAEIVAENEDLLTEILLRLPIKALLKFKLVSKPWLALISSPPFGLSHTRFLQNCRSLKPEALLLEVLYKKLPSKFKSLRLNPNGKQLPQFDFVDSSCVRIVQSCNGLLLCVCRHDNIFGNKIGNSLSYFICNPTIKKFKTISFPRHQVFKETSISDAAYRLVINPSETTVLKDYEHVGLNLAFDPLRLPYCKILSIWQQICAGKDHGRGTFYLLLKYSVDVFSSETNSWSIKKFEFVSTLGIHIDVAVFLNGAIHWDSIDRESHYYDAYNDRLKTMPMPIMTNRPTPTLPYGGRYFGESGGRLHIVSALGFSRLDFKVYEMRADYSNWFLKHTISLGVDGYAFVPKRIENRLRTYLMYCAFQSDEDEGDSIVIGLPMGKAISYNVRERKVKRIRCSNLDKIRVNSSRYRAYYYFETLSWPT